MAIMKKLMPKRGVSPTKKLGMAVGLSPLKKNMGGRAATKPAVKRGGRVNFNPKG